MTGELTHPDPECQQHFEHCHIVEAQQFDLEFIKSVFESARHFKHGLRSGKGVAPTHSGESMVSLFYEASTRTRLSFEMAAHHLGMHVVETESAGHFSSAAKGETLEDTIMVLNEYYPNVIVLRHNEEGAAARAAAVSEVPIINAGDGQGQHPTQALLDLFTIEDKLGRTENLTIVLGGDLARGRTARSLAYLLAKYPGNRLIFAAPEENRIGDDIRDYFDGKDIEYYETEEPHDAFPEADVVYWTRTQRERGANGNGEFTLTPKELKIMKKDAILMHPLPRVNEISREVDEDPRAVYFEQAGNGLFVRMALLEHVITPK